MSELGEDEKECPFCAEVIKAKAIKCKHCGELLSQASEPGALALKSSPSSQPALPVDQSAFVGPGMTLILGALVFFGALNMDTTVSTELGAISNISLIQQQSNIKAAGGFVVFLGFMWGLYASQNGPRQGAQANSLPIVSPHPHQTPGRKVEPAPKAGHPSPRTHGDKEPSLAAEVASPPPPPLDAGPISVPAGLVVITLATACIVWYMMASSSPAPASKAHHETPSPAPRPTISNVATRQGSGNTYVTTKTTVIATSKDILALSSDPERVDPLANKGLVFTVGPGVEISVISRNPDSCEVLVITGSRAGSRATSQLNSSHYKKLSQNEIRNQPDRFGGEYEINLRKQTSHRRLLGRPSGDKRHDVGDHKERRL